MSDVFPTYTEDGYNGDRLPIGGLTKRELFAAAAMAGLLAQDTQSIRYSIQQAVECADALIAELAKEKE
jgi:hypothetical protein